MGLCALVQGLRNCKEYFMRSPRQPQNDAAATQSTQYEYSQGMVWCCKAAAVYVEASFHVNTGGLESTDKSMRGSYRTTENPWASCGMEGWCTVPETGSATFKQHLPDVSRCHVKGEGTCLEKSQPFKDKVVFATQVHIITHLAYICL